MSQRGFLGPPDSLVTASATADQRRRCAYCGRDHVLLIGGMGVSRRGIGGATGMAEMQMNWSATLVACPSCGRMPRSGWPVLALSFLAGAALVGFGGFFVGFLAGDSFSRLRLGLTLAVPAGLVGGLARAFLRRRRARLGALAEPVE